VTDTAAFERDGVLVGIDVLTREEADAYLARIEAFEKSRAADLPVPAIFRTGAHIAMTAVDELVRHPGILEPVAALLGPDLMVWDSDVIIKEAGSEGFISWHQDLRYWGVDSTDAVTAWLALTDASGAMGCMRFIPGSHREGLVDHTDTFQDGNLLTRGQTVAREIDEKSAILGALDAGQMSIHHGLTFHASLPNRSDRRRVGLAIRYTTPAMRQIVADRDYAQLVAGEDRYGHFETVPRPAADGDAEAMAAWKRITDDQAAAYFAGVEAEKQSWTGGYAASKPA
jgi:non-heme Fe2+,alpha-ketoglutarate-dependent halogenase